MKAEFHGLVFDTPRVSCYLWSPWRASALEHRLFNEIRQLPNVQPEPAPDELRLHIEDAKTWKQVLNTMSRVLKGWQEEAADAGRERRVWRWLLEGDCDPNGYDHAGEPVSVWMFLRVAVDRGNVEEGDRGEEIDLQGIGLRVWPG